MKKYIFNLALLAMGMLATTSCSPDYQGTEPGNDSDPVVTVYSYEAARPLNPDNDVVVRVAANSQVSEAYYLAEKKTDADAHMASMGEANYTEYVITNGTKLQDLTAGSVVDFNITDLYGAYTITVVGKNGTKTNMKSVEFTGLSWTDVCKGTYYFGRLAAYGITGESVETTLQICDSDKNLYRFKDVYAKGYSLKVSLMPDYVDGKFTYMRVADQELPDTFTYVDTSTNDTYGSFRVRDVGYWQADDTWITDYGYESAMNTATYYCYIMVQYRATSPKNYSIGYGYDEFYRDED